MALVEWFRDFNGLDVAALAQLTPQARAAQAQARRALWLYADAMWDAVVAAGLDPAGMAEYDCIAALRDVGMDLYAAAQDAAGGTVEEEHRYLVPRLPPIDRW